jgi:hypothetical protein
MKILTYECHSFDPDRWHFSKVEFGRINLLVGDTATGKTRFLNTIFNLGSFAASNAFKFGMWEITFEHNRKTYKWVLGTEKKGGEQIIIKDNLSEIMQGNEEPITERNDTSFRFLNKEMPKLSQKETSVYLLKEEEVIKPIYEGFSNILRRDFSQEALIKASQYQSIPLGLIEKINKKRDLRTLFQSDLSLSASLFLLSEYFEDLFNKICTIYKRVFPFIVETKILDLSELNKDVSVLGKMPIFCAKEKRIDKWLGMEQLSSGMQKVLLLLADIFIMPDEGIYIIDEYENSLGINAIDFFPTFLLESEKNIQFFITSHHPYIINKIPVNDWYIFHRRGSEVSIKHGDELVERFGKSKQQAFVKLINDPFYTEGVE